MIALYIILSILAIMLFLLLLDISLVFTYKEGFDLKVRIFIFSLSAKEIAKMTSKKEKTKESTSTEESQKTVKKKKSVSDIFELISTIIDVIKAVLGEFAHYARIKLCKIKISIGSEDSAQTALIYGAASPALYTLIEFFDSFLNIKKNYKNIGIAPDFLSDECKADIKIILKIKIKHLLLAFVNILPTLTAKKGKEYE